MSVYQYGTTQITWRFKLDETLKHHYITIDNNEVVLLQGADINENHQRLLISKKAFWIKKQLKRHANQVKANVIKTGSRILYSGRYYYCDVIYDQSVVQPTITFNHSKFTITSNIGLTIDEASFTKIINQFYVDKCKNKLISRIRYWQKQTGLTANAISFKLSKNKWGYCKSNNELIINPRCLRLSPATVDYIIVHELCHTVEKLHNDDFWQLVDTHFPERKKQEDILKENFD